MKLIKIAAYEFKDLDPKGKEKAIQNEREFFQDTFKERTVGESETTKAAWRESEKDPKWLAQLIEEEGYLYNEYGERYYSVEEVLEEI